MSNEGRSSMKLFSHAYTVEVIRVPVPFHFNSNANKKYPEYTVYK